MTFECIDQKQGGHLRAAMTDDDRGFQADFLPEVRLHWRSCPACRAEFPDALEKLNLIKLALERDIKAGFARWRNEFLGHKHLLLAAGHNGTTNPYAEILGRLAAYGEEIQNELVFIHETHVVELSFGEDDDRESDVNQAWERSSYFIRSLLPELRQFTFLALLCVQLVRSIYWSSERQAMGGGIKINEDGTFDMASIVSLHLEGADERHRQLFSAAIADSGIHLQLLYKSMERAASDWSNEYIHRYPEAESLIPMSESPIPEHVYREHVALRAVILEMRQDFDNFQDSVKAGQMEIIRLHQQNRRAADFEAYISDKIGLQLYSCLHEATRQALQVAEYLYHINQEPGCFAEPVLKMAYAYENELLIRVFWPFLDELQASGTKLYDVQGRSQMPLIREGKVVQGLTLGNISWYLRFDERLRGKVLALGLDINAISRDAANVVKLRNRAAHEPACDRAVADDLRGSILRPDGIFSRVHPIVKYAVTLE